MQAYMDKETNRIVAYDREEINNCYNALLDAVQNYGCFYIGDYALYTDSIELLIFKIKQTVGIRMKELKNYTGDNKEELQKLYHSSLVDIRTMEYMSKHICRLIFELAMADAFTSKDQHSFLEKEYVDEDTKYEIISTSPELQSYKITPENNPKFFRLLKGNKIINTLKDGCDHYLGISFVDSKTIFRPENPEDPENKNGDFYTVTYKQCDCRLCNGSVYEFVSEEKSTIDWDVQLEQIVQRSRTINHNAPVRK